MKKFFVLTALVAIVFVFANCNPSKKAMATAVPKLTYENNLQIVIMANCVPCHIPAKGGNKSAFDNYAAVKVNIDDMIKRIELQPTDRGFMPFKGKKLSDSTINAFKQWRADGALEN